jgi:RalA-binding protein 1
MKPPPTPGFQKEKKRGIFGFRGRSSSDLGPEKGTPPGSNPDSGVRATFGVPLAESIDSAQPVGVNTELPAVMYRCIEYLNYKDAIAEEGIFRLSGSNTVIKALRERFNTEGDVDLVEDQRNYDIHAVASLLKLYLRELPASILTRELHLEFLQCLELNPKDRIIKLNVLVNRLPRSNRVLLQALSEFLASIVENADVNKMNVRNGKSFRRNYCPVVCS